MFKNARSKQECGSRCDINGIIIMVGGGARRECLLNLTTLAVLYLLGWSKHHSNWFCGYCYLDVYTRRARMELSGFLLLFV